LIERQIFTMNPLLQTANMNVGLCYSIGLSSPGVKYSMRDAIRYFIS